ncbi:MAG: bacillithiol biosynthesis cysteine-adding enzyme BshC [Trueperaceae bacterium]|nr:bacillithiol biosynthesis cysteine-adding enzyme BshC [Trueperaceae bacterium]
MIDSATEAHPSFLDRYRAGALNAFYGRPAGDLAAGLNRPPVDDPAGLAEALRVQARARGDRPAQLAAIDRLREPGARAIVTGQQAGLLLGPMYTLSKAITAVRLAQRLDAPRRPVVPVFWVASQDHDSAEIDHAWLMDAGEEWQRLSLPFPPDLPSGRTAWQPGWTESLVQGLDALGVAGAGADAARTLVREACASADSVADVFARMLSRLLGDDGLVVLDPVRPEMARRFAPVLGAELRDPRASTASIRRAGEALRAEGIKPQLGRGEDATNLFVQQEGGPRQSLRFDGRRFHPDGHPEVRWTAADLEARLADDPAAITPAAGLRPIVQDAALPTAAVVVGPGELRYFAQLRGVYQHHEVAMPTVWPRAEATVLTPPVVRLLDRHGLTAQRFMSDPDEALRARLLTLHGHHQRFASAHARLEEEMATMLHDVEAIDPTLHGPVRRGRGVLDHTVTRLRNKTADALSRRDRVTTRQFARLRTHLLPQDQPQERVASPFSFFAWFGVAPMMARLRGLEPEGAQGVTVDPHDPPPDG